MKKNKPPKWADRFLKLFCSSEYLEEVQGDLHEWYKIRVGQKGSVRAKLLYYYDVITYIRGFRLKRIKEMERNNNMLLLNYLKVAARQFKKNFWYSSLNAIGLTIGILSSLLISLYILDELSYDRFHVDHENIYRLVNHNPKSGDKSQATPSPWKINMGSDFPEIKAHTRLGQDVVLIKQEGQNFLENDFYWADENFMSFFSFEVLQGNREIMLTEPNSIVLTASKALRYFDRLDVVGEQLPIKVYDGNKDFLMKVTGVIEDLPTNSHLQFDFLGSMPTTREMYGKFDNWWGLNWLSSYAKLESESDLESVKVKVPGFFDKYQREGASETNGIIFQPLADVRLNSSDISGKAEKGNKDYIYLFGFVAVMILLAASINYVNLTTAKSSLRGKEVGMRKVFGGTRRQVARQFFIECGFQVAVALVLAMGLTMLVLPLFNEVVGKQMLPKDIFQIPVLAVLAFMFVVILVLSGIYPALVMNRFRPVDVVRGNMLGALGTKSWVRKFQVLIQFCIAAFLISSTLIVFNQMQHINQFDKGFNASQLISIPVDDRGMQEKLVLIKDRMSQVEGVSQISASGESLPSQMNHTLGFSWEGKTTEENIGIHLVAIDYDYLQTIEASLLMGRNLSKQIVSDSVAVCLINESAFEKTGWESLDGKKVGFDNESRVVAGVIENFHYNSLHSTVAPTAYVLLPPGSRASPDNLILRLNTEQVTVALDGIDEIWREYSDQPLDFRFVDESFASLYGDEQKFVKVVLGFSIIGIFLTVLGLVGLVSFMAERHSREISIRKVLGATIGEVLGRFSSQFAVIFIVAMAVALPLSYLAMEEWLRGFAFPVSISWTVFLTAALVSILITLLSVGSQSFKVASSNPIKYLSDH
ncbi:FtsX-like permease family protein [Roseivirga sp. E12]|uniref:FtsX-like permease family protein n=1 Tax=Roseivirga sp. E12 TaxID=2819237 RepID=UPI001ABD3044|nr:FtsX-like permease family protein [Roseivirga sp. E12]MBO3700295.1 FtsX-like permease family protein [Roseivirga sp. E12]